MHPERQHNTQLLVSLADGHAEAAEELLPRVYGELRALAGALFQGQGRGHTLQPTALVHEAYLKLIDDQGGGWNGQTHFKAVAAKAMRQVLIDHHRKGQAQKRGGDWQRCTLSGLPAELSGPSIDALILVEALERLDALDPRQARVVELRFFAGLTVDEIAEVLSVSRTTVEGDWRHARAWLLQELEDRPDPLGRE